MSIRIRTVGEVTVALCGVESDAMPGDLYLDDSAHYALAVKFAQDYQGQTVSAKYPEEWAVIASQKIRNARETLEQWHAQEQASLASESNVSGPQQEQQNEASKVAADEGPRAETHRLAKTSAAPYTTKESCSPVAGEVSGDVEKDKPRNRAQCRKCGDVIESVHRHDFRTCQCGAISVDGGKDYRRRLAKDLDDVIELSTL